MLSTLRQGQPLKEDVFFHPAETVPLDGVVPEQRRAAVVEDNQNAAPTTRSSALQVRPPVTRAVVTG
ncbi:MULTISPECIES: hypothetical protein [Streptomyces]|uniref:hypothetical protein n=1 Tax=Streptomyces scabiei TaxID=1930 RepID=UPI0004E7224E|nr:MULTISPECIES: hypothetical protein [Streptomyces]KFG07956.1 hypothetical protein IQ61_16475 [Streptomyces scabiei]MDW8477162.1 hypothetical protein [Streptomyces scabiei]MDX2566435.1 hypothetical protein [Streptomyces scabiei]MDX2631537.1 hypothetical protein [Streptomyces scabiei]MDX2834179.1 hypothetical protein [Streptomyces scabiei]